MKRTSYQQTIDLISRLNLIYINMMDRCTNSKHRDFRYYGGRGISVCFNWSRNPVTFIRWCLSNGWEPGLEMDRIDGDSDYKPGNIRFVTHQRNLENRGHGNKSKGFSNRKYDLPLNISFDKSANNGFKVVIKRSSNTYNVGSYESLTEAVEARDEALITIEDNLYGKS